MSSDIAIRVDGLSKRYLLRHNVKSEGLRHALQDAISGPFRKIHSALRRTGNGNNFSTALNRTVTPKSEHKDDEFWALRDVSLEIKRGEVVGIIGRNGAGKSTLLKILSRITEPTVGRIEIEGRVASLLEVGTGFHPELTGRENIFLNGAILGMKRAEVKAKFDEIVAFAEIERFLDTPVKRYSSGMYVRLAFAVAAHLEPEILIVDEVLAVGDVQFQQKCLGKMQSVSRSDGRTVLFVSHSLNAISSLCRSAAVLRAGQLVDYGNVSGVIRNFLLDGVSSEFAPKEGPLKQIVVQQEGASLVIAATWMTEVPIHLPNLGFQISDSNGTALFASNPYLSGESPLPNGLTKGSIQVVVDEPKLLDGTYSASFWFGNGIEDYVYLPNCIRFDIVGMASSKNPTKSGVGSVFPRCAWRFVS